MPGTPLRMAFSMTVEPFSASTSKRVPSKAMKVIFGMQVVPERYGAQKSSSADIITPLTESTATDSRGVLLYPADEALKLVDEQPETADRLLTVGARLDLAGTFGDGERTYPARRPDKT